MTLWCSRRYPAAARPASPPPTIMMSKGRVSADIRIVNDKQSMPINADGSNDDYSNSEIRCADFRVLAVALDIMHRI